ncbi:MAG TPA: hypothetical protein VF988_08705 [Verrucomicrobiae bacterium]
MLIESKLHFPATLTVTEQAVDISGFKQRQKDFYLNWFRETVGIHQRANKSRVVVGIAGPTGAGKSVVTTLFQELARQAQLPFAFAVVTIDAYHFPNSYLLSHLADGVALKQVKGRFDTYDVPALLRDLQAFTAGETVSFPAYSRKLHDPVPDQVRVTASSALLVLEGLWLLSDQGAWAPVRSLLDFCYFMDADKDRTRQMVLKRHMTGGRTLDSAMKHYEEVDGRNSDLVQQTRSRADRVLPPYYELLRDP